MRNSLITRDFNNNPFSLIEDFENDLARMFGNNSAFSMRRDIVPALDLVEKESHYVLSVDLPGVKKEDIHVEVNDNILRISGERKAEISEAGHIERSYGKFERAVKLARDISTEEVEAHFENGVLSLAIPKKAMTAAKQIEVKDGSKSSFWSKLLGSEDAKSKTLKEEQGNKFAS